jgi:hypothetical protein
MTTKAKGAGMLSTVWNAERDETRRLPPGPDGITVRVEEGLLLVTQAGDPEDHVLGPGQELRLEGQGLGVAWALEPSRAQVARGRPGARPWPEEPVRPVAA